MISALFPPFVSHRMNRNVVIAGGVVVIHAALLWALQTGLLRRAVEIIVPAQILSEIIAPAPPPAPPPPQPRPQPQIAPAVRPAVRQPVAPPAPQPLAIADPTPAPQAPIGVLTPQPPAPPISAPVALAPAAPPAPPAPLAPPRIVLPSSDADYLANPRPAYPPLSKRLGEQGKVVVRVLIGTDGAAQKAEVRTSSGFDRLDQAALATVQRWRYVPGKRDGVAEAMWFNVPINFVLE